MTNVEWLKQYLLDYGPQPPAQVLVAGRARGFSETHIYQAKKALKVKTHEVSLNNTLPIVRLWRLPNARSTNL